MLFQLSFPPAEVRCQSCSCPNKLMTLQMVTGSSGVNGLAKKTTTIFCRFSHLSWYFMGSFGRFVLEG